MTRTALLLAALSAVLAGCPLPQAVPTYPPGTVTPPRIVMDELLGDGAVILVPAGCTTTVSYELSPRVVDTNTIESIQARWFVNYDFRAAPWNQQWGQPSTIPPNSDTTNLTRAIPARTFEPYDWAPAYGSTTLNGPPYRDPYVTRVVEVVVSNGFDPSMDNTIAPAANRAPLPGFETQYYRWVFLTVPPTTTGPVTVQCPQ